MLAAIQFKRLSKGDVAYYQGKPCQAYVMCIEGRTRVFKNSESGRAILLYEVGPGETCVLTTTCLMAGGWQFVSRGKHLGALPATVFHWLIKSSMQFVFGNYGELLSSWQSLRSCETF